MSIFDRKLKSNDTSAIGSLVRRLVSNHEPTFLSGLREAVNMSDCRDIEGLKAIREAIRVRSKKDSVSFYEPGARRFSVVEELERFNNAVPVVLGLAKKRALLKDPRFTGEHIAALMQGGGSLDKFLTEVYMAGRQRAGFEFQLLYNELRCSARWRTGLSVH
jgi:hypothetical protein